MTGQRTASLLLLSFAALTAHADDSGEGPIVHTSAGWVRGFRQQLNGKVVNSFTGIRYGKAPVGELRFREPRPAEPWSDVADATRLPPGCIQTDIHTSLNIQDRRAQSEDCLFLNVWSPSRNTNASDLAVMVWIHGGGLSFGSSALSVYDGAFLAAYGDVIVVSMNYRLGSLGFLFGDPQSAPGNQGHLDQLLALQWVRDNVAAFGGDHQRVTLFGESSGSLSVEFHILSPISGALFQRAIMQSGALCTHARRASEPSLLAKVQKMATYLNCANSSEPGSRLREDVLECLRRVDPVHLRVTEEFVFPQEFCFRTVFGVPSLPDDPCTMEYPGNKDILIGHVANEGGVFASGAFPTVFLVDSPLNLTKIETLPLLAPLVSPLSPQLLNEVHSIYTRELKDTDFEKLRRTVEEAWGDVAITCSSKETSVRLASNTENAVFYYILNHTSSSLPKKAWHGMTHFDDVLYIFGRPVVEKSSADEQNYSEKLMGLWTSFAKYGTRHLVEEYRWPRLLPGNLAALKISDGPPEQTTLELGDRCRFWNRMYLRRNQPSSL